jgi:hypothetical protein
MVRSLVFARLLALLAVALLAQAALAEPIQSGPQADEKVPGPYAPLNVNGPDAGKKSCLYCRNGVHPVVMVFAREASPAVLAFIQKLAAATAANAEHSLGTCVIFCSKEEGLAERLGAWARQANVNRTILAVGDVGGPPSYHLSPEAGVTVLLYTHRMVKANHAFRAGEFQEKDIAPVLADLPKILAE